MRLDDWPLVTAVVWRPADGGEWVLGLEVDEDSPVEPLSAE